MVSCKQFSNYLSSFFWQIEVFILFNLQSAFIIFLIHKGAKGCYIKNQQNGHNYY